MKGVFLPVSSFAMLTQAGLADVALIFWGSVFYIGRLDGVHLPEALKRTPAKRQPSARLYDPQLFVVVIPIICSG